MAKKIIQPVTATNPTSNTGDGMLGQTKKQNSAVSAKQQTSGAAVQNLPNVNTTPAVSQNLPNTNTTPAQTSKYSGDTPAAAQPSVAQKVTQASTATTAAPTVVASVSSTNTPKSYDPDVDYAALINEAYAKGDTAAAERYEELRNQKVADMNAAGTNTNGYQTGYLDKVEGWANTPAQPGRGSTSVENSWQNDNVQAIVDQMNAISLNWPHANENEKGALHDLNEELAKQLAGYGVEMSYDPNTGLWTGVYNAPTQSTGNRPPTQSSLQAPDLQSVLDAWKEAAINANDARVDYAVEKGVDDLERAYEDAQALFQTQQNTITADEMAAKDNSALYAEMRGDKGGIGNEQYDSIANTAAINRQTVQSEQTKLATDTWRQIADLRAQGEFEKADAVLEITQTYLSQLISLEQWAAEYNLSVAQFEESIRQWEAEFEAQIASITGQYKGQPTLAATTNQNKTLASAGEALLAVGIMPSDDQLAAMGMTKEQAQAYIMALEAGSSGGGGNGGNGNPAAPTNAVIGTAEWFQQMYDTYGADAAAKIKYSYKALGISTQANADSLAAEYEAWRSSVAQAERNNVYDSVQAQLSANIKAGATAGWNIITLNQYIDEAIVKYGLTVVDANKLRSFLSANIGMLGK